MMTPILLFLMMVSPSVRFLGIPGESGSTIIQHIIDIITLNKPKS